MRSLQKKVFTSGAFLLIAMILSNIANFIFNSYLGRSLTFEQFGLVTLINTLYYIVSIFLTALAATVNQRVSFIAAHSNQESTQFLDDITKKLKGPILYLTISWIVLLPLLTSFFNVSQLTPLFIFTPIIAFGIYATLYKSYLMGRFFFTLIALLTISESLVKLGIAFVLTSTQRSDFAYISIPLSVLFTGFGAWFLTRRVRNVSKTYRAHSYRFPVKFYIAALLSGISTAAFLTFDILLTKHYFNPKDAGVYALLSLVGKMIFFLGSLANVFIISFVSKALAKKTDPNRIFYYFLASTTLLTSIAYLGLGPLGQFTLPVLFGNKINAIIQYLLPYTLSMSLFTIANTIAIYHLARKQYSFPVVSIVISLVMAFGIILFHQNISEVVRVILYASILNIIVMVLMHFLQRNGGFILANIVDFLGLLFPIEKPVLKNGGLRILIFNWRDIKHSFAGGAEVYIHELSKRLVKKGHRVTLFCGNDGKCSRYEIVDGVHIIRRGGFYLVYLWAFLYYVLKLRGKYDVIIDSENGLPFFTPLYIKREKIFLLMHHVHQDIFRKSLNPPFSWFAEFLELKVMPPAYKHVDFITVSPSTKHDIIEKNLTAREPTIIYNGVDLETYKPGMKTKQPMVLYVGRLKYYKSLNVFIKAAKIIENQGYKTTFIIAGEGEEYTKLLKYAKSIHSPVKFIGRVTEEEKIALYQKSWVFVNPSFMEGWGITTIEANACGTPVVASDVPGLRDSVQDGYSGLLVKYGDSKAFAHAIIKILNDSQLRMKLSKQALLRSHEFEWSRSVNKALELFNHALVKNHYEK